MLFLMATPLSSQVQIGQDILGEEAGDRSGLSNSLSSDGNRLAIGGYLNDENGTDAGHVRVYDLNNGTWSQVGQDIDGEQLGDHAGIAISLSSDGHHLAIGATGNSNGHVQVYEWDEGAWSQVGAKIDGEIEGDNSGRSVSLSSDGSRLAIGAGGLTSRGHVQVLEWNGTNWMQMGTKILAAWQDAQLGASVSLSSDGSFLALGAPGNAPGYAQVYEWNGEDWIQKGNNISSIEENQGKVGFNVTISSDGKRLAVDEPFYRINETSTGAVRIFEWDGENWTQMGTDLQAEEGEGLFGSALSLSSDGSRVSIGIPSNTEKSTNSGLVRVFEWNEQEWIQVGEDIYGKADKDQMGASASLSSDGKRVAIGAWLNDDNGIDAGHVRVYNLELTSSITPSAINRLEIYPNPTNGTIKLLNASSGIVRVTDHLGQHILQTEISNDQLDLSELPNGVYFIQHSINDQKKVNKLIKI